MDTKRKQEILSEIAQIKADFDKKLTAARKKREELLRTAQKQEDEEKLAAVRKKLYEKKS